MLLTYHEALNLLCRFGPDEPWVKHCLAVSKLATYFTEIFAAKYSIDKNFLQTAALLHDIGRYKTHDPILHGVEGYKLLTSLGHPREAFICASHILYGLNKVEAKQYGLPEQDFFPVTLEERLIPLFDSLVEGEYPTTLDNRLLSIRRRNQNNQDFIFKFEGLIKKAQVFMAQLDKEFNISMEERAKAALLGA